MAFLRSKDFVDTQAALNTEVKLDLSIPARLARSRSASLLIPRSSSSVRSMSVPVTRREDEEISKRLMDEKKAEEAIAKTHAEEEAYAVASWALEAHKNKKFAIIHYADDLLESMKVALKVLSETSKISQKDYLHVQDCPGSREDFKADPAKTTVYFGLCYRKQVKLQQLVNEYEKLGITNFVAYLSDIPREYITKKDTSEKLLNQWKKKISKIAQNILNKKGRTFEIVTHPATKEKNEYIEAERYLKDTKVVERLSQAALQDAKAYLENLYDKLLTKSPSLEPAKSPPSPPRIKTPDSEPAALDLNSIVKDLPPQMLEAFLKALMDPSINKQELEDRTVQGLKALKILGQFAGHKDHRGDRPGSDGIPLVTLVR